jgi:hypothetical protein
VVLIEDEELPPPDRQTIPREVLPVPRHAPLAAVEVPDVPLEFPEPVRPPPPSLLMKSAVKVGASPPTGMDPPPTREAVPGVRHVRGMPREAPDAPTTTVPREPPPPRPMPADAPVLRLGTLAKREVMPPPVAGLLTGPPRQSPPAIKKKKVTRPPTTRGVEIMRTLMDQIRRAPTPEARLGIITTLAQRDFDQLDPRAQEAITELRRRVGEQGLSPVGVETHERRVTHEATRLADLEDKVRGREDAVLRAEDRVNHLRARNDQYESDITANRNFADQLDTDFEAEGDRLRSLDQEASDVIRPISDLDFKSANEAVRGRTAELDPVLSRRNELRKQLAGLKGKAPSPESIEASRKEVDDELQKLSNTEREITSARKRVGDVTAIGGNRTLELGNARKQIGELHSEIDRRRSDERKTISQVRTQLENQRKLLDQNERKKSSITGRKKALEDQVRGLESQLKLPDDFSQLRRERGTSDRLSRELSDARDELDMVNGGLENLDELARTTSERARIDEEIARYRSKPTPEYADLDAELDNLDQEIRAEDDVGMELELERLDQLRGGLEEEEGKLRGREERLIKDTQNISRKNQIVAAGGNNRYEKPWLDWARISDNPSEAERELSSELQKLRSAPRPDVGSAEDRLKRLQLELDRVQRTVNERQRELNDLTRAQIQSSSRRKKLEKQLLALRVKKPTLELKNMSKDDEVEHRKMLLSFKEFDPDQELYADLLDIEQMLAIAADQRSSNAKSLAGLKEFAGLLAQEIRVATASPSPDHHIPDEYLDYMMNILKRKYPTPIRVTPEFQRKLNALGLFDAYLYFHYIQGAAKMLRINPRAWQLREASFRFPSHVPIPEADGLRDFKFRMSDSANPNPRFFALNEFPIGSNPGGYGFKSTWGRYPPFAHDDESWKYTVGGKPPRVELHPGGIPVLEYSLPTSHTVMDLDYANNLSTYVQDNVRHTSLEGTGGTIGSNSVDGDRFFTALDNYRLHEVVSPMARAHWLAVVNPFFKHKLPITQVSVMTALHNHTPETSRIGETFRIDETHTRDEDDFPEAAEALRQELQAEVDEFTKDPNAGLVIPLFPAITPGGLPGFNYLLGRVQNLNHRLRGAINTQTDHRERQLWIRVERNVRQNVEEAQRAMRDGNIGKAFSLLSASGMAIDHLRSRGG